MFNSYRNNMQGMPAQDMYNPTMAAPVQNMYNPAATMYTQNMYNPMAAMPAQNQSNPVAAAPVEQLETMYPETYNVLKPVVENACEKWMGCHEETQVPTTGELDAMITDVYNNVETAVENAVKNSPVTEERQFYGGGRRILRDFIGALLIGNLIRRRRPYYGYPFYGYPGYFGGGFYGGYPYY